MTLPTPAATHPDSRVARLAAAILAAIIVFTSFYPFHGWQWPSAPLFEFLDYPLPYYFRLFDNLVNFAIYVPFGAALCRWTRQRWLGVLLALGGAGLLSLAVESGQQFLPGRVASNLDILYNYAGTLIGVVLAVLPWPARLRQGWLDWRNRHLWAHPLSDYGGLLVLLWVVSQLNPSVPWFGIVIRPLGLPQPFIAPFGSPLQFLMLLEAGGAMLHLAAFLLFVSCFLTEPVRLRALLLSIGLALLLKLLAAGWLLKPVALIEWLNLNLATGLVAGFLLAWAGSWLGRRWRGVLALLLLAASQLVLWLWPLNVPLTELLQLFNWDYGHLANLNALLEFLSRLWPWLAAATLLAVVRSSGRQAKAA